MVSVSWQTKHEKSSENSGKFTGKFGRKIRKNFGELSFCNFSDLMFSTCTRAAESQLLGHDMGGCKTYGGRKTYQRTRPPEKFWTLQKKKSFWSAQSWIFVQEKQSNDTRGMWKMYRTRGVQNPFLEGVSFVRFSFPLLFPPPMASSETYTLL